MASTYNLVYREEEREMIPFCRAAGIGLIPWSMLARGFLAGTRTSHERGSTTRAKTDTIAHNMYYNDANFNVVERVKELAERHGVAPAQIALAWVLHQPGVSAPTVGTSKMKQLELAVAALDIQLLTDDLAALEEPYQPHPVLGHS